MTDRPDRQPDCVRAMGGPQFTPGPWKADRRKHCSVVLQSAGNQDGYANRVAECPHWSPAPHPQPTPDEAFANACLMAAAPDLYKALVELGTLVAAIYGNADARVWAAIESGIAAAAKARGES